MKGKIIHFVSFIVLLVSCSSPVDETPQGTSLNNTEDQNRQTVLEPSTENDVPGFSAEEAASLESLEFLDEYPLYSMHYYGSYSLGDSTALDSENDAVITERSDVWACSLFAYFADPASSLYGRNFDWYFSPAVLLFTDPPDGYASVSMVDIDYLGFEEIQGRDLLDLPASDLTRLLDAPYLPFDGMNEFGLVVGMAAVPESNQPEIPDQETIDSLMVIRYVLDSARTVDEALEIFRDYHLDWGNGPALHYLVADRSGRSILIEFWRGELVVIENNSDWQAATNFLQSAHGQDASGVCDRYDLISDRLDTAQEYFSTDEAFLLLDSVSQTNTQWSVVYGMSDGAVRVVMGQAYNNQHTLWLEMKTEE